MPAASSTCFKGKLSFSMGILASSRTRRSLRASLDPAAGFRLGRNGRALRGRAVLFSGPIPPDHNPGRLTRSAWALRDSWSWRPPPIDESFYVKGRPPRGRGQHGYIVSNANWEPRIPMAKQARETSSLPLATSMFAVMLRHRPFSRGPFFHRRRGGPQVFTWNISLTTGGRLYSGRTLQQEDPESEQTRSAPLRQRHRRARSRNLPGARPASRCCTPRQAPFRHRTREPCWGPTIFPAWPAFLDRTCVKKQGRPPRSGQSSQTCGLEPCAAQSSPPLKDGRSREFRASQSGRGPGGGHSLHLDGTPKPSIRAHRHRGLTTPWGRHSL